MTTAELRIRENMKTKNPYLDLGNCGLHGREPELQLLQDCDWLEVLSLSSNKLIFLPSCLPRNLRELNISVCGISDISVLAELHNLQSLDLSHNQISDISALAGLHNLQDLDISRSRISDISSLAGLHDLQRLYLSGNQISDISALAKLQKLGILWIYNNRISNISALAELHKLQILDISNNQISNISALARLHNLQILNLFNNRISGISALAGLHNLQNLDISHNRISDISPISNLEHLKSLYIYENPIKGIPQEIFLEKNAGNCLEKIKPYLENMYNTDYIFEGKLILVGEPAAGKTSLCRRLLDARAQLPKAEIEMTRGIVVTPWRFPYSNPKQTPMHDGFDGNFTAHIFDFGGQDILHATHRYFFSRRTVYVLVVDTRPEDTDFYYWLNVMELFGEKSPVIIVMNNKHGVYKEVPSIILEQFKHLIKYVCHVNLATNEGVADLSKKIQDLLQNLPHVGEERHPKMWNHVRDSLGKYWLPDSFLQKINPLAKKQEKKPYLKVQEFLELCMACDLKNEKKALGVAKTLHILGNVLYFDENPLLNDFIILDKHWATEAVYLVLLDETITRQHGKFTMKDLERLWKGKYKPETYSPLSELMLNFKIAYRKDDYFIAPQLLKENPPEHHAAVMQASHYLYFEYRYTKFMPKGLLSRLIVEKNKQIHEGLQWRTGVVLKIRDCLVEAVEHRYGSTNKLAFRVAGKDGHRALEVIFDLFEEVHGEFPNLKFEEMIPCHCVKCKDSQDPYFFFYKELKEAMLELTEIPCHKSWKPVSIHELLQGYESLAYHKTKDAENWINKGEFSKFFHEFADKIDDIDKPLFERLRQEFIFGKYSVDFHERAKTLIRRYM